MEEESKQQVVLSSKQRLSASTSSFLPPLPTTQDRRALARNLVQQFDQQQLHFAQTVEECIQQLTGVLERTRHDGPLSRERLDSSVQLLLTLAQASPHRTLMMALVRNLIAATYVDEDSSTSASSNKDQSEAKEQSLNELVSSSDSSSAPDKDDRIRESLATRKTFFELVRSLDERHSDVYRELQRIAAQVEYYDRNAGGHREALLTAINKWQKQVTAAAFKLWRQNVLVCQIQRTRLRDLWRTWQVIVKPKRLAYFFKLWKTHLLSSKRKRLLPLVMEARKNSQQLTTDIESSTLYIDGAQLRLGSLLDEIAEKNRAAERMNANVSELQTKINQYSAFRLSDVASYVLELVREMIVSLSDEIEFAKQAYTHDPFKMLVDLGLDAAGSGNAPKVSKGKKAKRASVDASSSNAPKAGQFPSSAASASASLKMDTTVAQAKLAAMSDPELLLLWLNHHIQTNIRRHGLNQALAHKYFIENLSSDVRDSIAFLVLCEEITPKPWLKTQLMEVRDELDADQRARLLLAIVHDFDEDAASVLTPESILYGTQPDVVAAFLGKLFSHHPALHNNSTHDELDAILQSLAAARREWEAMTTRVHKLKQHMKERELSYKQQRQAIYQQRKKVDMNDAVVPETSDSASTAEAPVAASSSSSLFPSAAPSTEAGLTSPKTKPAENAGTSPPITSAAASSSTSSSSSSSSNKGVFDELSPDDSSQYIRYTERFLVQFLRIYRDARFHLDRCKHAHDVWQTLQSRIDRFVISVLMQRIQGKPIALANVRDVRDKEAFMRLPMARASDILAGVPDSELALMNAELIGSFAELKKIFRFYASTEYQGGSAMNLRDFRAFISDCRLVATGMSGAGGAGSIGLSSGLNLAGKASGAGAGKDTHLRVYDNVFQECAEIIDTQHSSNSSSADPSDSSSSAASASSDEQTSATEGKGLEVTPGRFIELLLRLSCVKYKSAPSMSDRFSMLLRHYVLRHARKLDSDSFRLRYANLEILETVRKNKKRIRRMFEVCIEREQQQAHSTASNSVDVAPEAIIDPAGKSSSLLSSSSTSSASTTASSLTSPPSHHSSGFCATIDISHVVSVFKGAKIIGNDGMSLEEFQALLSHSRKSDFLTTAGIIGHVESLRLEYSEFVELLIACACVRYPDPYTPLAQRVDHFFTRELNINFH